MDKLEPVVGDSQAASTTVRDEEQPLNPKLDFVPADAKPTACSPASQAVSPSERANLFQAEP